MDILSVIYTGAAIAGIVSVLVTVFAFFAGPKLKKNSS